MPISRDMLSKYDQQVLESIFNPLELSSASCNSSAIDDAGQLEDEQHLYENIPKDILTKSLEHELEGVKLTEQNKLKDALEKFILSIELTPQRASIYNNRAQCLRLAKDDEAAFLDLNKAIELLKDQKCKTKCHALCQRGILYRKLEKIDEARTDFEDAVKMGSQFAKQQLVEINPYAALCNQMLRQAFDQLK